MPSYSDQQIAEALIGARGMVHIAARRLGASPNTVKRRLALSATVRAAYEEARGMAGDTAELRLFQAVERGEPWAIQFYLKTQARDRGYGERIGLTYDVRGQVRRLADELGLDPDEVLAEAEAILARWR